MTTNKIQLQSQGIKKALKSYKMYDSVAEYIWNGFDAKATKVEVLFLRNEFGGIDNICIKDNGIGIDYNKLSIKFSPIFESEKSIKFNKNNSSIFHGKNGVGRLTFFTLASCAKWETVFCNDDKKYKYSIFIDAESLENFESTEIERCDDNTGTTVILSNIDSRFCIDELTNYIQTEFSWYIELKRQQGCKLYVDNKELDNSKVIKDRDIRQYAYNNITYDVTFCRWNRKLNKEFSKYYYIDSNGIEQYKENTTLNNKGDKFYHSVYIKSSLFNEFILKRHLNKLFV